MAEDLVGKVAALEVYVKTHEDRLKKIGDTLEDLYSKNDSHEKEYRQILLQLQGICSEFSDFSVKIKEFAGVPKALKRTRKSVKPIGKMTGSLSSARIILL